MSRRSIIGAGLAGLSAAIELAKRNIGSDLISLQPSERAQSVLAEGGVNAALNLMGEGDTAEEHFADTMRGGAELADPNAVAGLTFHAPEIIRWLSAIGVPFQRENGQMIQRSFGGQKKKRTAYAKSSTGKILMTALIDEARKYEAAGLIRRFSHHEFIELDMAGGRCGGVVIRDTYTDERLRCPGPVILAVGGFNGLFPGMTTGTTQNTGDALATAFSQGVALANLEFIQYHPTTVQITGKRLLISEAARGEGGRLFIPRKGERWYFMEEKYPELGNLMPRDVISREMVRVREMDGCGDQVYLDLAGLSKETWAKKLPDMREEIRHYLGVDPVKEPVPVSPGIHFFMGGVLVDEQHRTNIPGLYAAGECACQYHGANRLGGNSLLGALYGGRVAAETAAADQSGGDEEPVALGQMPEEEKAERFVSADFSARLAAILRGGLDIIRDEATITRAAEELTALGEESLTPMEARRLVLGRAMLASALSRKESRGAHTRADYPGRDDAMYQKTTVVTCRDGEIDVSFRQLPERRAHGDAD